MSARVLLIDNYDSFTYNLVQAFLVLGAEVTVHRNDQITVAEALKLDVTHLVISPGPGRPDDAGVSLDMIAAFEGRTPILGVCLGHQSIGQAFGGTVTHAGRVMHGKTSLVHHNGQGLFTGFESFTATRYHSLVVERDSLPDCLEETAWTDDGEIMALRHRELPVAGVQFHPESIDTENGHQLLQNFLDLKI